MGFSRTNLFKRLESSGAVFLRSLERHILRNAIFIYALNNGLDLPIGTQDIVPLENDTDEDIETVIAFEDGEVAVDQTLDTASGSDMTQRAKRIYETYQTQYKKRFKWVPSRFFQKDLGKHLEDDANALLEVLQACGDWRTHEDKKLNLLFDLITKSHPNEKIIVFTQFADTVAYLEAELKARGVTELAGVVGKSGNPSEYARRFSPKSNGKRIKPEDELRVLIATDVLSEGQNLQDAHIVVNYDIAWAIIRLIQRAGRVDRIGQEASEIYCYSFLPADGVERIIRLRQRVLARLQQNAEVVGTDEQFFEDEDKRDIIDLYSERETVLEDASDGEVDLSSYALEIWNKAIERNPSLKSLIERMPPVSYGTRAHVASPEHPEGVLVYLRSQDNNDILAWLDTQGNVVSESQYHILNTARCEPSTPALERALYHHEAVSTGVQNLIELQISRPEGQLGRKSGARYKVYERLKAFAIAQEIQLFYPDYEERGLFRAVEEILAYPLRTVAAETLNRHLRTGITDGDLAELVINLRDEERLCIITDNTNDQEPRILCSLGLKGQ